MCVCVCVCVCVCARARLCVCACACAHLCGFVGVDISTNVLLMHIIKKTYNESVLQSTCHSEQFYGVDTRYK